MADDQEVLGSNMPSDNAYGQNGYTGASSDLPGQRTKVGGGYGVSDPNAKPGDWQTRSVSHEQYPAAYGMKGPKSGETIPSHNTRRSSIK